MELLVTRLQYELLRQGVSQRELARKARVNKTSLSRICNGKEPAYPARGKRIAVFSKVRNNRVELKKQVVGIIEKQLCPHVLVEP